MLKPKTVVLTGHHVQLEPLQETHREILKTLAQDENVSRYSPPLKLKFDAWFDKALKSFPETGQLTFIVRTLADQHIVGSTRFYDITPKDRRLSIGYTWYIPSVWGTGINTECKLLLMQHAFDVLQANRIEFFIDASNERSRAAVKKLGATEEGLLRQHVVFENGYVRDTAVYSILKQEWAEISSRLTKKIQSTL